MNLRRLSLAGLGLLVLGLAAPPTASASIVLTFDQPLYTISAPGGTAAVQVFVEQVSPSGGEPTVDASNGLTAASIAIAVASPSVAFVQSAGDIAGGVPPFDAASGAFFMSNPALGVTSLLGVDLTMGPVLLGTFTFTGLSPGSTLITSALEDAVTPNFTDVNGDNLDPFVVGSSATITVAGVPEPSTLISGGMAGLIGLAAAWRKRNRRATVA